MIFIVIWLICGLIGALIAPSRGYSAGIGLLLGMLLGLIGLIIIAVGKPKPQQQPMAVSAAAPGWYPINGQYWWWDGAQYTAPASPPPYAIDPPQV